MWLLHTIDQLGVHGGTFKLTDTVVDNRKGFDGLIQFLAELDSARIHGVVSMVHFGHDIPENHAIGGRCFG